MDTANSRYNIVKGVALPDSQSIKLYTNSASGAEVWRQFFLLTQRYYICIVIPDSTVIKAIPDSTVIKAIPDSMVIKAIPDSTVIKAIPNSTVIKAIPDCKVIKAIPDSKVIIRSKTNRLFPIVELLINSKAIAVSKAILDRKAIPNNKAIPTCKGIVYHLQCSSLPPYIG